MTHKCRGSIVILLISKSVEPNEEQKEMISGLSKVFSASTEIVGNRYFRDKINSNEQQVNKVSKVQQGGTILYVANDKPGQFLIIIKELPRTHWELSSS